MSKEENEYTIDCQLFLKNVTVEDAGKYKVTARNDLGESNATISLNFDSKHLLEYIVMRKLVYRKNTSREH